MSTVMQIYKERKNLAFTLQDARSVVSKLEMTVGCALHILLGFLYLIIFDVSLNVAQACSITANSPTLLVQRATHFRTVCSNGAHCFCETAPWLMAAP